jgi:hypothetical protein
MANGDAKVAGRLGPLRSPMADNVITRGPLNPPIGANTTIPGTAPKAAPIRSPLQGQPTKNWKNK